MDDAAKRGDVDEAVESLPAFSTEAANPALCGSDGERNQENKSGEADGDERALGDVFPHGGEIEGLVGSDVGEEVQANVGESEQTNHAAEADEIGEIEKFAQRSDGKSDEEEAQRPIASEVLKEFDGIGAELSVVGAGGEEGERGEAKEKDDNFAPTAGEEFAKSVAHVSNFA